MSSLSSCKGSPSHDQISLLTEDSLPRDYSLVSITSAGSQQSDEYFKSRDHAEILLRKMQNYLENDQLCDVTLIAGINGKRISAHRLGNYFGLGETKSNGVHIQWYKKAFDKEFESKNKKNVQHEDKDGCEDTVDSEHEEEDDHPRLNSEGSFHIKGGNYDLALRLFQMVYENQKVCLAVNKCDSTATMCDISLAYTLLHEYSLAIEFYEAALQNKNELAAFRSNIVIKRIYDMASVQIDIGHHDFALQLSDIIMNRFFNVKCYDAYDKFDHACKLTNLYAKLKGNDVASHCYPIISEFKVTSTGILRKLNEEASHHISQGNNSIALQLYEIVFGKQKEYLGEDHHETIKTMSNMASVQNMLQDKYSALNIYRNVLVKQKRVRGEFHPDTLKTMYALASLNDELGNEAYSLQIYRKLFELQKFLKGSTDSDTIKVASSVASLQKKVRQEDDADNLENYIPNSYPVEFKILQQNTKRRHCSGTLYVNIVDSKFAQLYVAKYFDLDVINVSSQDLCSRNDRRQTKTFINEVSIL